MQTFIKEENYRYERKFVVPSSFSIKELINLVKKNTFFFREVFHVRQVNNIYLGTPAKKFYFDNVYGVANRKKVRIRWYGDTFGKIKKAKLEVKIKQGHIGDKWTFPLDSFKFDSSFAEKNLETLLNNSKLPESILELVKDLLPTSINSYTRRYYLSADRRYRITLDYDIKYRNAIKFNNIEKSFVNDENNVVELKYEVKDDLSVGNITKQFPFFLGKNSKYVNGVNSFNKFSE